MSSLFLGGEIETRREVVAFLQHLFDFIFYYLDANAVRTTAGRKTTSIYGDNFRSPGFD